MASIFTYDPDPPRVSSPWLAFEEPAAPALEAASTPGSPSVYRVKKLQAEPQAGPTEYKLHLLLRQRRAFMSMSTNLPVNTPRQATPQVNSQAKPAFNPVATSKQIRQERLQHLTTQLLWRLQQSSPYHASSSKQIVSPRLPDHGVDSGQDLRLQPLVPGLEESEGALYELGVADDGTLVGLTQDELDESLVTLRVMATSLGCTVHVVRSVIVGDCSWIESTNTGNGVESYAKNDLKHAELWAAEALVKPHASMRTRSAPREQSITRPLANGMLVDPQPDPPVSIRGCSKTPQLRITFTGPTTSGKTSLLGTLSTGTFDNGRGKSRLSLLKHPHELISGVTSSIAQELIGYKDQGIVNFSHSNIESWIDIHDHAEDGRLVFVSDSGGHPRYRRTVLRGLMNWAPHWTILCIAADAADEHGKAARTISLPQGDTAPASSSVDLVDAHLSLLLALDVPLAIAITKLDLASKAGLQTTMNQILTSVKAAGRLPRILQPDQRQHEALAQVPPADLAKVQAALGDMNNDQNLTAQVPIVLTSAVKGTGIGLVHALFSSLPLPSAPTALDFVGMALNPEQPECVFHVDDTFSLSLSHCVSVASSAKQDDCGVVVSGHVRFGTLSVGDSIVIGPFQSEDETPAAPGAARPEGVSCSFGSSWSQPSLAEMSRTSMRDATPASAVVGQWHNAQIISIRNLRLPVRTLAPGQAGSIGLVFDPNATQRPTSSGGMPRIRRGMVLAVPSKHMLLTGVSLQAASGFTAEFTDPRVQALSVGCYVNVYFASVRAAARILHLRSVEGGDKCAAPAREELDDTLLPSVGNEVGAEVADNPSRPSQIMEVFLELLQHREWIELGSKVMLIEGGHQDRSGLEACVGRVVEIVD